MKDQQTQHNKTARANPSPAQPDQDTTTMKPEKTKGRTSLCLRVLSLLLGGVPCVIGLIALFDSTNNIFDVPFDGTNSLFNMPLDYWVLLWFLLVVLGVLAVITGLISRFKVGVVLGAISAVFCTLLCLGSFFIIVESISSKVTCRRSMEILGNAIQEYCEQNEGTLPGADTWCDQLLGSVEDEDEDEEAGLIFVLEGYGIVGYSGEKMSRFAINNYLDGCKISEIDRPTVLLFETDSGWNQNGTLTTLPPKRHPGSSPFIYGGYHFVFVGPDSTFTVELVKDSELNTLNWTLK